MSYVYFFLKYFFLIAILHFPLFLRLFYTFMSPVQLCCVDGVAAALFCVQMDAMKLGVKEMKKEYKKIKIDDIEVREGQKYCRSTHVICDI